MVYYNTQFKNIYQNHINFKNFLIINIQALSKQLNAFY